MSEIDKSVGTLGRQAVIYSLAFLVSRAASFLMLPVYTRILTPADYGVLQLVQMTVDIAAIVLAAGITNGIMRFYFKAEDENARRRVLSTSIILVEGFNLVTGAALVAAAPLVARHVLDGPESVRLVHIAAASISLDAFTVVPLLLLQLRQRATAFAAVSLARLTLQVTLNVVFLVGMGWGVQGVVLSSLVTNVVVGAVLGTWIFRQVGFAIDRGVVRRLLRFGLPYRVTQAGTFLLTFGDRYFLKAFHGLTVTGLYALAYQFGFVLMYAAHIPFMQAWNPQRFALVNHPREERDAAFNEGLVFQSLLTVSVATGIALFVSPVIRVMSDPAFHSAAALVPLILAAYVFQGWTDVVELGIQVSERTEYATVATWISVITVIGLYILLVPPLAGLGAALATLISFAVRLVCFYWWSQRLWPVSYRWRSSLLLLTYGTVCVGVGTLLRPHELLLEIGFAAALFGVYAAAAWFGGVLSSEQRERVLAHGRERWLGLRATLGVS